MHITFVALNFTQSDLAAEEKHYFDYHVEAGKHGAASAPSLRLERLDARLEV